MVPRPSATSRVKVLLPGVDFANDCRDGGLGMRELTLVVEVA